MHQKISKIFKTIGPAFITASVVLGPGSITVSSRIGAAYGYSMLWVIVAAGAAMWMYVRMSSRFGVMNTDSILTVIAKKYGRWFSVLIGVSCFMMAASFQFGNNLGVATAMETVTGIPEPIWPFVFTGLAIVLVFFAKNLYKIMEKIMMVLVLTMIISFFLNLLFTKPDIAGIGSGFVPRINFSALEEMAAITATTFCLHVALYQSAMVQDKGWTVKDIMANRRDSLAGIIMLGLISMMIIITSASALFPRGISVASAGDMAIQLEALFGPAAKYIFSIGLWAAGFSSLTVNASIGGGLLSDGLGLGRYMEDKAPRAFTILIMLVGMIIAVFFRGNIVHALVIAQASTLFAVPAVAIGLFLIANNKDVMKQHVNTWKHNILAVFGLILILLMVYYKYHTLVVKISQL